MSCSRGEIKGMREELFVATKVEIKFEHNVVMYSITCLNWNNKNEVDSSSLMSTGARIIKSNVIGNLLSHMLSLGP